MSIGESIKSARKAAKLTQKQLAEKMGVTPQHISSYERDIKKPKFETLKKIADALGYTIKITIEPKEGRD